MATIRVTRSRDGVTTYYIGPASILGKEAVYTSREEKDAAFAPYQVTQEEFNKRNEDREGTFGGRNDLNFDGTIPDTGVENAASSGIFNIAGYWTLGIIKGVSVVFVPIIFVGLASGFMMKVVQTGAKIGAME